MTNDIDSIKQELNDGYALSKLHRDNALRHSRGWVSSLVDFVLLGLPIVAPIPNLLNLRIALAPVMGWGASTIAAVAFELLLFGSAEIILYLQDKQMRDGGYEKALKIAMFFGALFLAILLALIAAYEVPLHGPAVLTLPFVSVISIAFLSLKRWADIRDSIESDNEKRNGIVTTLKNTIAEMTEKVERMVTELESARVRTLEAERLSEQSNATSERLSERVRTLEAEHLESVRKVTSERDKLLSELSNATATSERSTTENERLNGIISELKTELSGVREESARLFGELSATRSDKRSEDRSEDRSDKRSERSKRTQPNKQESMQKVLEFFTNNPMGSLADCATEVGKGKSTVSDYLKEMEKSGMIHRNGSGVQITE